MDLEAARLRRRPSWSAQGNQPSAYFGGSVASAGDVNGDGYSDVLVGAFEYSEGQVNEGRAYLYLGSATGLSRTPAWTAEGDQALASFGFSVATAGDVNGDGYSDVLIGAPHYDYRQTEEGRVYLYLGSAAGLMQAPAWTAEGAEQYAYFGASVASAGDVNRDGYCDVLIGAQNSSGGGDYRGRAYLYLGSAAGLAHTPAWSAEADQDFASFGFSVAGAGDVNGDGYSDVLAGAPRYDSGELDEGRAYLYLGSPSGLASLPAWTTEGDQFGAWFGYSVASAGDVNSDGYDDVLVGARYYAVSYGHEGRASLYLGSAGGLGSSPAWSAYGNQANAWFGSSVARAGDVNGDGYGDVLVGAYGYDNGQVDEGRAYLYLGSDLGLASMPRWGVESNQGSALLGVSVGLAGDVNGDNYSDVLVGSPGYSRGGVAVGTVLGFNGGSDTDPSPAGDVEVNSLGEVSGADGPQEPNAPDAAKTEASGRTGELQVTVSTQGVSLGYALTQAARVRLAILDVRGALVAKLFDGDDTAGVHRLLWDGRTFHQAPIASGIYFARLEAAGAVQTRRFVIQR